MTEQPKGFFAPLKGNGTQLWFWILVIILPPLKMRFGDWSFFDQHWSQLFEPGPEYDWIKWLWHFGTSFVLLAVIPIIVIKGNFKHRIKDYGIQLGDWKFGLIASLALFALATVLTYFGAQNPNHWEHYPQSSLIVSSWGFFALWALCYFIHYCGMEFFMRGFVLFGGGKHYNLFVGLCLQTALCALMHLGKTGMELYGAIFTALILGLLAIRTRSILWPILCHLFLSMINAYWCGYFQGINQI